MIARSWVSQAVILNLLGHVRKYRGTTSADHLQASMKARVMLADFYNNIIIMQMHLCCEARLIGHRIGRPAPQGYPPSSCRNNLGLVHSEP